MAFTSLVLAVFWLSTATLAATKTPIRNTAPVETANPQQAFNPIYYPLPATKVPEPGVAPEELLYLFMERHTATEYAAAAEAAIRLCEIIPDRPEGHYNLACALSRLHRTNESLDALQKSIDAGWRDLAHLEIDPDLANVRSHARFEQIVSQLKAALQQERILPTPLRADAWEEVALELRDAAPQIMAAHHVPGTAIALIREGNVVWSESFGVRDRRSSDALESDHRFRIRAPLHLLVMIAAGQQQTAGQLEIAKLLEDGASLDQPRRAGRPRDDARPAQGPEVSRVSTGVPGRGVRERDARGCQRQPNYSANSVYGLLKLAVEMASNQPFSSYCINQIIRPLQMRSTAFARANDLALTYVTGHSQLGSPMDPDPRSDEAVEGGALYTTANDLARLVSEIMQAGKPLPQMQQHGESAAPQSPAIDVDEAQLTAVCAPWVFELVEEADELIPHGLGLAMMVRESQEGKRIEVADNVSGMGCLIRWYPEKELGIVVLYNSATGAAAAQKIAHIALGGS